MAAYLFTWNPARWNWPDLHDRIMEIKQHGYCRERWGCAATTKIRTGDRAFLIKLGQEPRGIMASGWVAGEVYEDLHWDTDQHAQRKMARYVDVDWDTLLDPESDLFPRGWLTSPVYANMRWEPRASGARIPATVAEQLEQDWAVFLTRPHTHNGQLQTTSR